MLKKVSLSMLAIGAVSLVVTAASYALFTAQTSNTHNTFATGTVQLGPFCGNHDFSNIAPGDSGSFDCTVAYTGSLDAWVSLSTASAGALLACDGTNSLQLAIADDAVPSRSYVASAPHQLMSDTPVSNGFTRKVTVNWSLPLAAGNTCQNKTASLDMTGDAVQARNNMAVPGPGPVSW